MRGRAAPGRVVARRREVDRVHALAFEQRLQPVDAQAPGVAHHDQVLAFVAMEPPDSLAPEDVRDRKAELLEAVRPFSQDELVRGQYVAGVVEGQEAPGYRDQELVSPESTVETFVGVRAWVDNPRW